MTVDIGGTSLDACVIEGGAAASAFEAELEHYPLLIPIYDIRTIGAGGGSIAWLDGGLLKVGPRSAGAEPGPVCYGRGGTEPTVTDAAVCLGYVDPQSFLSGAMRLADDAARAAVDGAPRRAARHLGRARGGERVRRAARPHRRRGAPDHRRARPRPARLLAAGVRRGRPADRPAAGAGDGDRRGDRARRPVGVLGVGHARRRRRGGRRPHADGAARRPRRVADSTPCSPSSRRWRPTRCRSQGVAPGDVVLERRLELRYLGQEHALPVVVGVGRSTSARLRTAFEELHVARYGHAMDNRLQVLNVRVRGDRPRRRARSCPSCQPGDGDPSRARTGSRPAFDFGTPSDGRLRRVRASRASRRATCSTGRR